MSTQSLMELNNLKSAALKPKTELVVAGGTPMPVSTPASTNGAEKIYIIKAGDTIETVSKKYDIPVAQLIKANKKKNALVKVGESIVIPKN